MTQTWPNYPNPPVAEAIIDLRTVVATPQALLRECANVLADRYPIVFPLKVSTVSIELGNGSQAPASSNQESDIGARLTSSNNEWVVQLQTRGFTFSQLNKYRGWDAFYEPAKSAWDEFHKICRPTTLNRVALRYINKIVIPEKIFEFSDYFNIGYTLPGAASLPISDSVNGMFLQLQLPQSEPLNDALGIVNLMAGPHDGIDGTVVMLDFDLFVNRTMDAGSPEIWNLIREFRERKNIFFEACITEKTRSLFK